MDNSVEIIIYQDKQGKAHLDVHLLHETVWLSLNQMVELFGRDKSVISRHLKNIFQSEELEKDSVVAFFATTASDGKTYQVEYFNLDAIISVGYRVNSKKGTQFRQWATQLLKKHLLEGYTYHEQRLQEKGLEAFRSTLTLLENTLINQQLVNDIGTEALRLINQYAKTWHLLLAYDEGRIEIAGQKTDSTLALSYEQAITAIAALKKTLQENKEASALFGQERESGLLSILGNLEQTFDSQPLYPSIEAKAAHLLYFIIKDHPFTDGNKRIGSFLFLLYLNQHHLPLRLNDNGLVALALLIAESAPSQKELLIGLTTHLLNDKAE